MRTSIDEERGSAALEFILVGVVLLVPIVYLIVALGAIQEQALGVEAGARHLARTIATSSDAATADERADRVLTAIVEEYGIDRSNVEIEVSCASGATACPEPGAILLVTVSANVTLPLVPQIFGLDELASVPVEATGAQKISRFWGTGQ